MKNDNVWIYALIWGAVFFLVAYCLTGCEAKVEFSSQVEKIEKPAEKIEKPALPKCTIIRFEDTRNFSYVIVKVDGCEYIWYWIGDGQNHLMHKANCSNHQVK